MAVMNERLEAQIRFLLEADLRNRGRGWREHGVTASQIFQRNEKIAEGSEVLWVRIKAELDHAVAEGVIG